MKRFIVGAVLFPVTLFIGWVASNLADAFERSLDDLDFEDE